MKVKGGAKSHHDHHYRHSGHKRRETVDVQYRGGLYDASRATGV